MPWGIERVIPYAKNARVHTDAQVAAIAASIKEWGWTNSTRGRPTSPPSRVRAPARETAAGIKDRGRRTRSSDRRELLKLLNGLAPGDVVTATRIDRLACSTFDLFAMSIRSWTPRRNSVHRPADTGTGTGASPSSIKPPRHPGPRQAWSASFSDGRAASATGRRSRAWPMQ
jgi:hypothetical protein